MHKGLKLFLWLLALVSTGNALWMLAHAWSWFAWVPGVADTGEPNAHFIHDVGIAYLVCAIGFVWSTRNAARAWPVMAGITLFFAGHALGHVVEILLGQLPHSHWVIDLPLVFLPAILLVVIVTPAVWKRLVIAD
ncbi:MAG: hypothetical protein R3352_08115 [Salinisphaeraceae bacterium]|nr:hypothetical protein [Salinisphaeraceae bacterium]